MRPVIVPGPWLLQSPDPSLAGHRARFGPQVPLSLEGLTALATEANVLGRGGAGFPFAVKLAATVSRRSLRRHVVVNLSEGEPASVKDAALAVTAPHLVLDGAALTAHALGVRVIDIVVPSELHWVETAVARAVAEREASGEDRKVTWRLHRAAPRFVAGESSAVTELVDGRVNLPVTSWAPTAIDGVHGRPTLLSNGETFAQVGALVLAGGRVPGPAAEPGTRLLSITRGTTVEVHEVVHGTSWSTVLTPAELARPVLLGGYHGQWAAAGALGGASVSTASLHGLGLGLGAGVVIPLPEHECPLVRTADILGYLAGQSAGRCGPCVNGLPALADAFATLVAGGPDDEVALVADLVRGRGACAHPDGTVRLVASACTTFPEEIRAHRAGSCSNRRLAMARPA